ncbi:MAG: 4-hydroxy-3-methylbut-2-enyl diphosphate reductase [Acidobacteriota bacterium]|nr:4-hydroxy-3-methylbut-2-enyl diphosphate reductase [Acidobacteriota bacterium]
MSGKRIIRTVPTAEDSVAQAKGSELSPPSAKLPPPGIHYRRGLGLRKEIIEPLTEDYRGHLVRFARDHDYRLRAGELRFLIAHEFGFCYGVDRAIEYAYEARLRFPDRRIFLTGEIIHNPYVNRRLSEFGILFLETGSPEEKFGEVGPQDVVLLPAFGVPTAELDVLRRKGSILVDTTCGSVMNVWKNVDRYKRDGFTSVVHGKYAHEETRATTSRAGTYLVVRDMAEAQDVCRYIEAGAGANGGAAPLNRDGFIEQFAPASSPGFDPDRDLGRIGLANQTTMLASESLEIAAVLRDSMARRYGEEELAGRFRSFDTICSATQERQDAVLELLREDLDLILVVGGFNSSNTANLAAICDRKFPSYHIAGPEGLLSADEIRCRPAPGSGQGTEPVVRRDWLPEGPLRIGVTSGASTPDVMVHRTMVRVLEFRGMTEDHVQPDESF